MIACGCTGADVVEDKPRRKHRRRLGHGPPLLDWSVDIPNQIHRPVTRCYRCIPGARSFPSRSTSVASRSDLGNSVSGGDGGAVLWGVVLAPNGFYLMLQLITILNRCHRFPGFVYRQAHFSSDHKSIEIAVRPRKGSAAVCSRCHHLAPDTTSSPSAVSNSFLSGAFWFFCCTRCGALTAAAVRRSSWRKSRGAMASAP